jgi:hypothetical protein
VNREEIFNYLLFVADHLFLSRLGDKVCFDLRVPRKASSTARCTVISSELDFAAEIAKNFLLYEDFYFVE